MEEYPSGASFSAELLISIKEVQKSLLALNPQAIRTETALSLPISVSAAKSSLQLIDELAPVMHTPPLQTSPPATPSQIDKELMFWLDQYKLGFLYQNLVDIGADSLDLLNHLEENDIST